MKSFAKSIVLSYSQIFFSYSPWFGLLLLVITFFNPPLGICGLLAVIIANMSARWLHYNRDHIENGHYGINALLVGLEVAYFYNLNFASLCLLVVLIINTVFLTVVLNHLYQTYLGIPIFSLPFVLISIIFYFATYYTYTGLSPRDYGQLGFNRLPFALWEPFVLYFQALSIIFFQTNVWAGVVLAIVLLCYSRILFLLSLCGFMTGMSFCYLMGGSLIGPENAFIGFNFIFVAIAVGGIFFVPSFSSFCLAMVATLLTAIMAFAIKTFVLFYHMPVFALPYNLVIFVLLLAYKQRGVDCYPKMVDFVPGRPEENLNYYLKNIRRFSSYMLVHHLYLPFKGRWTVSQGSDGKHTHKNYWQWALDFQMLTFSGKTFEHEGNRKEDYPSFGAYLYAPLGGQVVAIENNIADNEIGQVDTLHNWGNYVILHVTYGVYIKLAHLLRGSIPLTLYQHVKLGDCIGKVGNSGRSPYPHLHLQVQNFPMVNSPTIPFRFDHYVGYMSDTKSIVLEQLPQENDVVQAMEIDEKFSETFNLYVNRTFEYRKNGKTESVVSQLDFHGRTFLESNLGAKLYFRSAPYFFYLLDFEGNHDSVLYHFYRNLSRVPLFYEANLKWHERLYYPGRGIKKVLDDLVYFFFPAPAQKIEFEFGKKIRVNTKICYLIRNSKDSKILLHPKYFILRLADQNTLIEQVHPDFPNFEIGNE